MGSGRDSRLRRHAFAQERLRNWDKVYNTYFVVRGDNAWADKHTDELQSVLLMTEYELATGDSLTIDLLKGYSCD